MNAEEGVEYGIIDQVISKKRAGGLMQERHE